MVAAVKRRTDKHVVCSKTIVATPETVGKVVELCKGMMEFSQRRAAESDSGILAFDVSQDIYDGNVVHFWERYESNAHMGRHNTSAEFSKFMQDVRPTVLTRTISLQVLIPLFRPLTWLGAACDRPSHWDVDNRAAPSGLC